MPISFSIFSIGPPSCVVGNFQNGMQEIEFLYSTRETWGETHPIVNTESAVHTVHSSPAARASGVRAGAETVGGAAVTMRTTARGFWTAERARGPRKLGHGED